MKDIKELYDVVVIGGGPAGLTLSLIHILCTATIPSIIIRLRRMSFEKSKEF